MVCFLLQVTENLNSIDASHEENRNVGVGQRQSGDFGSSSQQAITVPASFLLPPLPPSIGQRGCSPGNKMLSELVGLGSLVINEDIEREKRHRLFPSTTLSPRQTFSHLSLARAGPLVLPSASS